jgi:hypothetical protein
MMADENPGRALGMVRRVEQMCDFIEHPAIKAAAAGATPVTMPPEVGALGFDIPFWAGFGTVGLWAALDALREGRLRRRHVRHLQEKLHRGAILLLCSGRRSREPRGAGGPPPTLRSQLCRRGRRCIFRTAAARPGSQPHRADLRRRIQWPTSAARLVPPSSLLRYRAARAGGLLKALAPRRGSVRQRSWSLARVGESGARSCRSRVPNGNGRHPATRVCRWKCKVFVPRPVAQ